MKVAIITCFESNEERVKYVRKAFESKKDEVKVYTTDFSHAYKTLRNNIPEGYEVVYTMKYKKNMSYRRIRSHIQFAIDVFMMLEDYNPDLIWLMAPANSLIRQAAKYKKKHQVKIIGDIIDMWPESLPVNIDKNILPFKIWRNLRKNNLKYLDTLCSECDFYKDELYKEYPGEIETLYWAKENSIKVKSKLPKDELSLVYIGSINNIIDINLMKKVIENIDYPVSLHIIGVGESKDKMLELLKDSCRIIDHGIIRDEKEKAEIFAQCHAGINLYKDNLYIGLTVKCLDYFGNGLPIINNIKADTFKLVEEYGAGINIDEDGMLDYRKLMDMRKNNKNIYKLFNEHFSADIFIERCKSIIEKTIKK